jgi:hypothetical protein
MIIPEANGIENWILKKRTFIGMDIGHDANDADTINH